VIVHWATCMPPVACTLFGLQAAQVATGSCSAKRAPAVNIATSLAVNEGLQVGLLDADIHGPSVPTMMNLRGKPGLTEGEAQQPCAALLALPGF
jgi:hypothetical protein